MTSSNAQVLRQIEKHLFEISKSLKDIAIRLAKLEEAHQSPRKDQS